MNTQLDHQTKFVGMPFAYLQALKSDWSRRFGVDTAPRPSDTAENAFQLWWSDVYTEQWSLISEGFAESMRLLMQKIIQLQHVLYFEYAVYIHLTQHQSKQTTNELFELFQAWEKNGWKDQLEKMGVEYGAWLKWHQIRIKMNGYLQQLKETLNKLLVE